jgi:hypothetical protein
MVAPGSNQVAPQPVEIEETANPAFFDRIGTTSDS